MTKTFIALSHEGLGSRLTIYHLTVCYLPGLPGPGEPPTAPGAPAGAPGALGGPVGAPAGAPADESSELPPPQPASPAIAIALKPAHKINFENFCISMETMSWGQRGTIGANDFMWNVLART